MADEHDREPTPQEAQRDGQSAISQDGPLRELHQEGTQIAIDRSPRGPLHPNYR